MTIPRNYDVVSAIDTLFPGIVTQSVLWRAAYDRVNAKSAPLDSSDVTTILANANALLLAQAVAGYVPTTEAAYPTTLPSYPTGLPRFPDGYGGMQTPDGWSRTYNDKVVRGNR